MNVIPFPYASPAHRFDAIVKQAQNAAPSGDWPALRANWRPLAGDTVRCRDTQRLLRLECCAGHPDRPVLWTARDIAAGISVVRPPTALLPFHAEDGGHAA